MPVVCPLCPLRNMERIPGLKFHCIKAGILGYMSEDYRILYLG